MHNLILLNNLFFNYFKNKGLLIYIYYIRKLIYFSSTTNDLINILNNINFIYGNLNCDQLMNFIILCFNFYPLKDEEIQKFSIMQQKYNYDIGIDNYVTTIFWLCIIYIIDENEKKNTFVYNNTKYYKKIKLLDQNNKNIFENITLYFNYSSVLNKYVFYNFRYYNNMYY